MADLDSILNETISSEGGFVDDPNDDGGATNYGITQATLSAWLGRSASIDDVKAITIDEAKEIYTKNFLTGPRIDTLPSDVQPVVFDMSVNMGPVTSIKLLQRTINMANYGPVDLDGIIGPQCRAAATAALTAMGGYFINAIVDERISFYRALAAQTPSDAVFLTGWINRANTYRVSV